MIQYDDVMNHNWKLFRLVQLSRVVGVNWVLVWACTRQRDRQTDGRTGNTRIAA